MLGDVRMSRGSDDRGFYEKLASSIRDQRFVFMNHGYANMRSDDFAWLKTGDEIQKYSLNLIKHLLKDISVRDKMVLDIGCGRGGSCSYMVRYLKPMRVYGLEIGRALGRERG